MAQEGGTVIICSRRADNLKEALEKVKGLKIEGYTCNIGKKEERQKLVDLIAQKYGRIDVLVCNQASSTFFGTQMDITEAAYDKMWDLNVKSIFFLIKECKELLIKAGPGANVLVLSSVAGKWPSPFLGVYDMTKAALDNMIIWLSKEFMDLGIRVNGLAPGLITTKLSEVLWKDNTTTPEKAKGVPEQIGSVAATMCSKDGSFINGETYYVHGGYPQL